MENDAVLIQQVYSNAIGFQGVPASVFSNMARLTFNRHSAYAMAHKMDYYNIMGNIHSELIPEAGSWAKAALIRDALVNGYQYVFWIDADAGIVDMRTDLRDAVKDCEWGACVHDPAKSAWLKKCGVEKHINVGVMYIKNTEGSKKFADMWLAKYPGIHRWAEQGAFNDMVKEYPGYITAIDDKWNATIRVNEVENPVVYGWHGITYAERYAGMKEKFKFDFLEYPV
jgi:hypothetical protein